MRAHALPPGTTPLALLLAALLGLAAWQGFWRPEEDIVLPLATRATQAAPALPPPAAARDFAAITERPLFAPERRRPAALVPAAIAAPAPPPPVDLAALFEIVGLTVDEGRVHLLLRPNGGGAVSALRSGEALREWTLVGLDGRRRVVFERDGDRQFLEYSPRRGPPPEDEDDDSDDEDDTPRRSNPGNVRSPVRAR
jgi:hypothetical protein